MSKMSGRRNLDRDAFDRGHRRSTFRRRRHSHAPATMSPRIRSSRALAPAKKPLTRGLSVGPQADPAATAAEGTFRSDHPQPRHALAFGGRARGNRHHRQGQAEHRSGNQLRLQFGRYQREVAALGSGAGTGADQSGPEGFDLRRRGLYRRRRRRRLQSGPVRAARRLRSSAI